MYLRVPNLFTKTHVVNMCNYISNDVQDFITEYSALQSFLELADYGEIPNTFVKRCYVTNSTLYETSCVGPLAVHEKVLKLAKLHASESKDHNELRFDHCFVQPRTRNAKEFKSVLFNGKAQYICERKSNKGSKSFRVDGRRLSDIEILQFAEEAFKTYKDTGPTITSYLTRVDIIVSMYFLLVHTNVNVTEDHKRLLSYLCLATCL